jgi:hypothetical protein
MLSRRIREHIAKLNWLAVLIDLAIVVIGVFLGLQVNNWNEQRIERAQGKEYRARLIADLRSNDAHDENRKAYWEGVRRHARSALAELQNPPERDGRGFLIDAYQASQVLTRRPKRFTYDELVSTGRVEQIGGEKLREEVSSYYVALDTYGAIFDSITPYRELLRQRMPSAAQESVRRQCPEAYYPGPDGTPFIRLPDHCSLDLDPPVVARSVSAVRSSPNIVEDLNRLIADLDVKLSLLAAMSDQSRRLRSKLEAAQARSD